MIEHIRHLLAGIAIALLAFLRPIGDELLSLIIVFVLNFFVGVMAGMIANHEDFDLKKAFRCIAEATVFFVLCCAIYAVGNLKQQHDGALQCVSCITWLVIYCYSLNILKNLKKVFRRDTAPYMIVSFLYYVLKFKFVERIPFMSDYLNFTKHESV